jgi:hypothetical protein
MRSKEELKEVTSQGPGPPEHRTGLLLTPPLCLVNVTININFSKPSG